MPRRREPPLPEFVPPARCVPCSWPLGEPHTEGFRFCRQVTEPGRLYCATHEPLALRPVGALLTPTVRAHPTGGD